HSPTPSILPPPSTHFHTRSLHDALPISISLPLGNIQVTNSASVASMVSTWSQTGARRARTPIAAPTTRTVAVPEYISQVHWSKIDRKSTRLNSSHEWISYAVFCLKKKNK